MTRGTRLAIATAAIAVTAFVTQHAFESTAEAAPAFRWPWAGNEGWRYTQGFHTDYALDFQPQIAPNCDDLVDTAHTIRPVAPGTVTTVRMRGSPQPAEPAGLVIDHGGGWSSYYTHLANVPAAVATIGAQVGYDTDLGNPSCYTKCDGSGVGPPCATGRHIHFQIRKDGNGSGILQATICGWTVSADGGLTRNGITYYEDKSGAAPIANAYCPAGDPATATPPVETPAPPPTPARGDANCDFRVNTIDATVLLQFSSGLMQLLCDVPAADANANGRIDPIDAQLVLQFSAGVIAALA